MRGKKTAPHPVKTVLRPHLPTYPLPEKLHSLSVPDTPYHFFDLNQKLSNLDLDTEIKQLSRLACSREISFEEICSQYNQGHVKEGVGMGALLLRMINQSNQKPLA